MCIFHHLHLAFIIRDELCSAILTCILHHPRLTSLSPRERLPAFLTNDVKCNCLFHSPSLTRRKQQVLAKLSLSAQQSTHASGQLHLIHPRREDKYTYCVGNTPDTLTRSTQGIPHSFGPAKRHVPSSTLQNVVCNSLSRPSASRPLQIRQSTAKQAITSRIFDPSSVPCTACQCPGRRTED